jgi:dipeptidyl-peptidase-4
MRVMIRAVTWCPILAALPAAVAAQAAAKQLQPIDMFRLDFLMQMGAEEPVGWLDALHYLVFDAGPGSRPGAGPSKWWRVEAGTGTREPWLDDKALRAALGPLLGGGDDVTAALDDQDAWTWSDDHTRFVVDVGGDLFAGGRDGAAVRLTNTPDVDEVGVRFSPDGSNVAFVASYNLHVVPAAGGDVRALTTAGHDDLFFGRLDWVYQEELYGRGNFQGYWWAPDGAHIALLKLDEAPVQEFVLVSDVPARPEVERTNYP